MSRIFITIPLTPPSANTYVRHSRGRHFLRGEAQSFKDAVIIIARGSAPDKPITGIVTIRLDCHFKSRRCPDIDNLPKLVLDGLQAAGMLKNDNQVDRLEVRRHFGQEEKTEITVEELG